MWFVYMHFVKVTQGISMRVIFTMKVMPVSSLEWVLGVVEQAHSISWPDRTIDWLEKPSLK